MIPLKERIGKHRKEFEKLVMLEKIGESFVKRAGLCKYENSISPSPYSKIANVTISVNSFDEVELDIVPRLSGQFGIKWSKTVSESGVTYSMIADILTDTKAALIVIVNLDKLPEGECKITPVLTGRKVEEYQLTLVRRDEVVYHMECADES